MKRLISQEWQKILLYLAATLVLGTLLAPWLYLGGQALVEKGILQGNQAGDFLHSALERSPFSRYFDRAVMLVALVLLIPTVRWLHFAGREELQLTRNPCAAMDCLAGMLLGAGFLLLMGASFLYFDLFLPDANPRWSRAAGFLGSALVIAVLEEWFFRGAILGVLLRQLPVTLAVILCSLIFAFVHFIHLPKVIIPSEAVTWSTGFEILPRVFEKFADWKSLVAEFLTLFAVGVTLCVVRLRTWSLWLPIGLHMGWVFGLKLFNGVTDKSEHLNNAAPWVGADLKTGLIPLIIIVITGAFASLWIDLSRRPASRFVAEATAEPS